MGENQRDVHALVDFEPFFPRAGGGGARRLKVVVGTSGNLYPCAPMVGEDHDRGPEAALRLNHVSDDPAAIARSCDDGCATGGACACAAYLETGDPTTGGENGRWFAGVCCEIGAAVVAGLAAGALRPIPVSMPVPPQRSSRRAFIGALIGGGLALAGGGELVALRLSKTACTRTAGEIAAPPPPEVQIVESDVAEPPPLPPGGLAAPGR